MSKSQQSAVPPAGNTTLFQKTDGCRPTRHFTSQAKVVLAHIAIQKGIKEKLCVKPGASRATFRAGCGGNPVCIDIQTTQMIKAQPLKKINVNQSIKAPRLRPSVGSAKAARAANAGSANNNDLSAALVVNVAALATATNQRGSHKWRLANGLQNKW
jgi:hypothetical protein